MPGVQLHYIFSKIRLLEHLLARPSALCFFFQGCLLLTIHEIVKDWSQLFTCGSVPDNSKFFAVIYTKLISLEKINVSTEKKILPIIDGCCWWGCNSNVNIAQQYNASKRNINSKFHVYPKIFLEFFFKNRLLSVLATKFDIIY